MLSRHVARRPLTVLWWCRCRPVSSRLVLPFPCCLCPRMRSCRPWRHVLFQPSPPPFALPLLFPHFPLRVPLDCCPVPLGLGIMVGTPPQETACHTDASGLRHLHHTVLHVNLVPHSQQALTARQAECAGAMVCYAGSVPFSFPPFYPINLH